MAAHAQARGWRYDVERHELTARFEGEPFERGRRRRATRVLEGTSEGRPFLAFDYSFVTSGVLHDARLRHFSVLAIHLGTTVPELQILPQSSFGRIFPGSRGTDQRIGVRAFDDAFHVRGEAPGFTRDVLTPTVCEAMLAARGFAWRFTGDSLLVFRRREHDPGEIDEVLARATHVLGLVPARVWAQGQGGGRPTDAPV